MLRRLAPMLQWFGSVLSLGAVGGLIVLSAGLWAPASLAAASAGQRAGPHAAAATASLPPTAPSEPPAALAAALEPYDLWIPKLRLRAPVVPITPRTTTIDGQVVAQLDVPSAFAAGWNALSAPVGAPGNTVLIGHNNSFGEVFRGLGDLAAGDEIVVYTAAGERRYAAAEIIVLEEQNLPLAERLANAAWIAPTSDERLTLVTCWPYFTNTHRVIVVAHPLF
jgi:LPXTG-site transpeptidase (sortase) family protein